MTDREIEIIRIGNVLNECCNYFDECGNHLGNKCSSCEYWCDTNHICCSYNEKEAEALYNAGYRKASDVAREIFEEIERAFFQYYDSAVTYSGPNLPYHLREAVGFSLNEMFMKVAELKKKYMEEGK